jgi:hypothetical protein
MKRKLINEANIAAQTDKMKNRLVWITHHQDISELSICHSF